MTPYLLIAALALPTAALAHDPLTQPRFAPAFEWLDGPAAGYGPGSSRIRIVRHGQTQLVALTVDQTYLYQAEYNKRLTQLAMQMPVAQAQTRASDDAVRRVLQVYTPNAVGGLDRKPLQGARIGRGS